MALRPYELYTVTVMVLYCSMYHTSYTRSCIITRIIQNGCRMYMYIVSLQLVTSPISAFKKDCEKVKLQYACDATRAV